MSLEYKPLTPGAEGSPGWKAKGEGLELEPRVGVPEEGRACGLTPTWTSCSSPVASLRTLCGWLLLKWNGPSICIMLLSLAVGEAEQSGKRSFFQSSDPQRGLGE